MLKGKAQTEREIQHQAARQRPTTTGPCCAKCRRGIKGFGELPCGYEGDCPNRNCGHSKDHARLEGTK